MAGSFVVGVVICYWIGTMMLKPLYNIEATIQRAGRGPDEKEVGWGILNIRAELTMIRGGVTILNGLAAAIVAGQLF